MRVSTLAVPTLFGRFTHAAIYSTLGPEQLMRVFALPAHPDVPHSPALIVERFGVIGAPPEPIYDLLANAEQWPSWDPAITYAETEAHRPLQAGDSFSKEENGADLSAEIGNGCTARTSCAEPSVKVRTRDHQNRFAFCCVSARFW